MTSKQERRVLIVDDNEDAAESLRLVLKADGFHCLRTTYAREDVLRLVEEFRPGTVLLDLRMPALNGIDVSHRIRAAPGGKCITLIAISGWCKEEYRWRSRGADFDGHVLKPVNYFLLSRMIG